MRHPRDFDDLYRTGRDRLLLQTFALTGDLPSARDAVEAAYVAGWRHRRRLARSSDPEAWLRSRAWRRALRRRPAAGRPDDTRLDPGARATLHALDALTPTQRRVLVLAHLTDVEADGLARESGLGATGAWQALRTATDEYAGHRDVAPTRIPLDLADLAAVTGSARLPRPSIVRRSGARGRRRLTGTVAAALALAGVAGTAVVLGGPGVDSPVDRASGSDGADGGDGGDPDAASDGSRPAPEPRLEARHLLTAAETGRLAGGERWRATTDGSGATPRLGVCQAARPADPDPRQTLVRQFSPRRPRGRPVQAAQSVQLSAGARAARAAYEVTMGWYARCTAPRTQLLSVHRVDGVGDEAHLVLLRRWGRDAGTVAVGLARTERVVTAVVRRSSDQAAPPAGPLAAVLERAVDRLCLDGPGTGTCAIRPILTSLRPPRIEPGAGLLDDLDFPQAGTRRTAWRATEPGPAPAAPAAFACDDSDFSARPVRDGRARSFLMVDAGLPDSFGVTQHVGTLPSVRAAREFVAGVRAAMASCEEDDQASTVTAVAGPSERDLAERVGRDVEVGAWRVRTEVGEDQAVTSMTAVLRRGPHVSQIGFVTAPDAGFDDGTFLALAERATERLAYLGGGRPRRA